MPDRFLEESIKLARQIIELHRDIAKAHAVVESFRYLRPHKRIVIDANNVRLVVKEMFVGVTKEWNIVLYLDTDAEFLSYSLSDLPLINFIRQYSLLAEGEYGDNNSA